MSTNSKESKFSFSNESLDFHAGLQYGHDIEREVAKIVCEADAFEPTDGYVEYVQDRGETNKLDMEVGFSNGETCAIEVKSRMNRLSHFAKFNGGEKHLAVSKHKLDEARKSESAVYFLGIYTDTVVIHEYSDEIDYQITNNTGSNNSGSDGQRLVTIPLEQCVELEVQNPHEQVKSIHWYNQTYRSEGDLELAPYAIQHNGSLLLGAYEFVDSIEE